MKNRSDLILVLVVTLVIPLRATADSSFTINNTSADAFLAAGSAGNPVGANLTGLNFGGAGTLAIAPASSTQGEFDSIIMFNTASAVAQFNSLYGAGQWQITGFNLQLASNFGGQGEQPNNAIFNNINAGSFGIDWLAYDNWTEGTGGGNGSPGYPTTSAVSFNSIPTLFSAGSASLGTFAYSPPGDNVYVNYTLPLSASLTADAVAGGDLSPYFYAADDQVSYLFNARSFSSNHPELSLTAAPIPEPASALLLLSLYGGLLLVRRSSRR